MLAIITEEVGKIFSRLEIGPLNHSHWLTLACRLLQFFFSQANPTKNLSLIVEFVIKVYFPSWFNIKKNNKLTHELTNLYNIILKLNNFLDLRIRQICYNVLNSNSFLLKVRT